MELFAAIEQWSIAQALKTSFFAYPLVNAVHIMAIGALFTSVLLMDLRLLGAFASVEREPFVRLLRRVALTAFAFAVMTGALMFTVRARDYASSALFLTKLTLIGIAALNFLALIWLVRPAPAAASLPARLSIILSMLLWTGVILAGRFLGFV